MEYWKTTVTILLPLLANIFSYWGLLRSGGLNTRKYWLVEVRRPQYEKILASRGDWEWLYCDSSRGIRWNIAWALGKSLGLRPRDFPRAQAIFHRIPRLESQYSHSQFPNNGSLCHNYSHSHGPSSNFFRIRPRDFPQPQLILHCIPLFSSQCSHS